jgi:hypothetical protein
LRKATLLYINTEVVCADVWRTRLAHIDCSQGGAQEAYSDLCRDFERAGWELERRVFDRRYVRRNDIRLEIAIGDAPTPRSNLDECGYGKDRTLVGVCRVLGCCQMSLWWR